MRTDIDLIDLSRSFVRDFRDMLADGLSQREAAADFAVRTSEWFAEPPCVCEAAQYGIWNLGLHAMFQHYRTEFPPLNN